MPELPASLADHRDRLSTTPGWRSTSRDYEIASREGAEYARAHGISSVPAVVVNCGPPVLLEDYDSVESFDRALRERIACEAGTGSCNGAARHHCTADKKIATLSVPTAFVAGLVAGINPCLLAVMVFIAGTTLSTAGSRTGIIARILSFCGGLMAVYLLIGIGLMELIGRVPGLETGSEGGHRLDPDRAGRVELCTMPTG